MLEGDDERERLLEALAELIAARGWQHFVLAPRILPTSQFFPDQWTPDDDGLWRLSKRLLRYAGLGALDVDIDVFADDDAAAREPDALVRSERHQGTAAWFAGIDGTVCRFGANVNQIDDPLGVTASLAHETAHAFRCYHGLAIDELLAEEQLTDLTTVYLGFALKPGGHVAI